MQAEMIGKVIGDYEITEVLGEGGMGVVFQGTHKSLGQIVAVKMLHPNLTQNDHVKERFFREAKAMARLRHPNILTLYNFQETEDGCFIIMEFVEGETYEDILKERGTIPPEEAVEIFTPILSAMDYAHDLDIIHRDIKPGNLMRLDNGVCKVLDFGTAKIVGGEQLTQAGMTLGTIVYMSPEQLLGQDLTPAADIYSLGVTLFELLTGHLPFFDENDMQLMRMILREEPKTPSDFVDDVPDDLEAVIMKSLAKEASDRYQTAEEFREALLDLEAAEDAEIVEAEESPAPPPEVEGEEEEEEKTETAETDEQVPEPDPAPRTTPPGSSPAVPSPGGGGVPVLLVAGIIVVIVSVAGGVVLMNVEGVQPIIGYVTLGAGLLVGVVLVLTGALAGGGAPAPAAAGPAGGKKRPCPSCGRMLLPTMTTCPFCNPADLEAGESTMVDYMEPPQPVEKKVEATDGSPLARGEGELVIVAGPNEGENYKMGQEGLTIGRSTDNDIVLRDLGVSGHHARVDFYDGAFFISDLQSSNGTFVDGRRIDQSAIANGDVIQMGQSQFNVRVGG